MVPPPAFAMSVGLDGESRMSWYVPTESVTLATTAGLNGSVMSMIRTVSLLYAVTIAKVSVPAPKTSMSIGPLSRYRILSLTIPTTGGFDVSVMLMILIPLPL